MRSGFKKAGAHSSKKEAAQDTLILCSALSADSFVGDGLKDQIPEELRAAAEHLHRHGEVNFDQVRSTLTEHLAAGPESVAGYARKLQGQIGEDRFISEHSEFTLASSGSQEAVDAWRETSDGLIEAVQIKTWASAEGLTDSVTEAREAIGEGLSVDGNLIDVFKLAVPSDIAQEAASRLASVFGPGDVGVVEFESAAESVASVVEIAVNALESPAEHLGSEILDFIPGLMTLTAAAEVVRVVRGDKTAEQAGEDLCGKIAFGVVASVAAGATALLVGGALAPIGVGMYVRYQLNKFKKASLPQSTVRPFIAAPF